MYPILVLPTVAAVVHPTTWEALEFGALLLLATSTALLWRRMRRPAEAPRAEGLPLVVAAAAVAAVIDEPHRIVGITEVPDSPRPQPNPWSLEGRRSHFASHQLR